MNVGLKAALTVFYLIALWAGYRVLIALYNISPLHPLSRFPGPKIAAASYLYEAYFDWWCVGRYGHEIRRMHERYGNSTGPDGLAVSLTGRNYRPNSSNQPRRASLLRPILHRRDIRRTRAHPRQMATPTEHGRRGPGVRDRVFDRLSRSASHAQGRYGALLLPPADAEARGGGT